MDPQLSISSSFSKNGISKVQWCNFRTILDFRHNWITKIWIENILLNSLLVSFTLYSYTLLSIQFYNFVLGNLLFLRSVLNYCHWVEGNILLLNSARFAWGCCTGLCSFCPCFSIWSISSSFLWNVLKSIFLNISVLWLIVRFLFVEFEILVIVGYVFKSQLWRFLQKGRRKVPGVLVHRYFILLLATSF